STQCNQRGTRSRSCSRRWWPSPPLIKIGPGLLVFRQTRHSAVFIISLYFFLTATRTFISCYQLALLHIKLIFGHHHPFMKTAFTERFTLVLFKKADLFKG